MQRDTRAIRCTVNEFAFTAGTAALSPNLFISTSGRLLRERSRLPKDFQSAATETCGRLRFVAVPSISTDGISVGTGREAHSDSGANEKTSVHIRRRNGDDQHRDENAGDNQAAVDQRTDGYAWLAQWQQIVD
jgi:hypothetical protein